MVHHKINIVHFRTLDGKHVSKSERFDRVATIAWSFDEDSGILKYAGTVFVKEYDASYKKEDWNRKQHVHTAIERYKNYPIQVKIALPGQMSAKKLGVKVFYDLLDKFLYEYGAFREYKNNVDHIESNIYPPNELLNKRYTNKFVNFNYIKNNYGDYDYDNHNYDNHNLDYHIEETRIYTTYTTQWLETPEGNKFLGSYLQKVPIECYDHNYYDYIENTESTENGSTLEQNGKNYYITHIIYDITIIILLVLCVYFYKY